MALGIKELKPHLFGHDCRTCHRAGILRCRKCFGLGFMRKTTLDARQEMKITAMAEDNTGVANMYACNFCKGKGTETCGTCQGQGWQYEEDINYRKFQPHPIFEGHHRSRDRLFSRNFMREKIKKMRKFDKQMDKEEELQEQREKALRKVEKEAKKKEKEKKKKSAA